MMPPLRSILLSVPSSDDPPSLAGRSTPRAGLIVQAIEEGGAQYFANDRLRALAARGGT
jgi:hypothetical protein